VFTSKASHDDGFVVELVPPVSNAWVIVDASMDAAGSICSGKADAILRTEQRLFSFYAPPEIESSPEIANTVKESPALTEPTKHAPDGVQPPMSAGLVMATTTTTTTKAPCMIMTTSFKQQHGTTIVLINFKRDPESWVAANKTGVLNVSGKIQWFPQ